MPPQGLLVVAASLPPEWPIRFIDENIAPATEADFRWSDVVFVSGMHVQRREMNTICARAHALGRTTVLGGPSVSADPARYPDFDYLHIGELGDAFEALIARLSNDSGRPDRQIVLTTGHRRPLSALPIPAYEKADLPRYFLGSIQFSSGCPYECEFCDIPALYGRVPQLKSAERIIAELDRLVSCGVSGAVYFVDDNFIAHRRAVRELLPHRRLARAQWASPHLRLRGDVEYRPLSGPVAANARCAFRGRFLRHRNAGCSGAALHFEKPNLMGPIIDAIATLNRYGMEVVSGIIMDFIPTRPKCRDFPRFHRAVTDPHADDQSFARLAEESALGPPATRRPHHRGRRSRVECGISTALRRRGWRLAALHG